LAGYFVAEGLLPGTIHTFAIVTSTAGASHILPNTSTVIILAWIQRLQSPASRRTGVCGPETAEKKNPKTMYLDQKL